MMNALQTRSRRCRRGLHVRDLAGCTRRRERNRHLGWDAQASFANTGPGDRRDVHWRDFLRTRERRFKE